MAYAPQFFCLLLLIMLNMLNCACLIPPKKCATLCVSPYVASAYLALVRFRMLQRFHTLSYAFIFFQTLSYDFIRFLNALKRYETLTYDYIQLYTLTYAFKCFHMLSNASIRFQTLWNAYIRLHMLTYAYIHIRFHMLLLLLYTLLYAITCFYMHRTKSVTTRTTPTRRPRVTRLPALPAEAGKKEVSGSEWLLT